MIKKEFKPDWHKQLLLKQIEGGERNISKSISLNATSRLLSFNRWHRNKGQRTKNSKQGTRRRKQGDGKQRQHFSS